MWIVDKMLKRHSVQKRLAIVMSFLMVLSLLWDSHLQVRADRETVVITVTDIDGVPVSGASVSYKISAGPAGSVSGDNAQASGGVAGSVPGNGTEASGNAAGSVSGDGTEASGNAAGSVSGDGAGASGDADGPAPGDSVSGGNGNTPLPDITGSGATNIHGKMEIEIPDFAEGMTISMEISQEGFGVKTVAEQPLEARMAVTLRKLPEIQALDGVYNKLDQELVTVAGSEEAGDMIRYSADGVNWQENVPTGKAAGEYAVYVQVSRAGYKPFESGELTAIIRKAVLNDVGAIPYSSDYDGKEHPALTFSRLEDGDRVTCTWLKGGTAADIHFVYNGPDSVRVPAFRNAGDYAVHVRVERDNYEVYEEDFTAVVKAAPIQGLSATLRSGLVYDGQEQDLLEKINGLREGDRVYYALGPGDEPQPTEWMELTEAQRPRACDAGSYRVRLKVERENYKDTEIELSPAKVCIAKAEPLLTFVEEPVADTVDFDRQGDNVYNFSVSCNELGPQDIMYTVENVAGEDQTDIADIASIVKRGENAGKLTIIRSGHIIRITASTAETDNYVSVSKSFVLSVRATDEDLIRFADREVRFTLGTKDTIASQAAEKSHEDDNGAISYQGQVTGFPGGFEDIGIELSDSGQVTLKDLKLLSEALEKRGSLSIVITALKEAGTKEYESESREVYARCKARYTIVLSTEGIPDGAYAQYNPEGEEILPENLSDGWYNTAVIVRPAEGYTIARDKVTNEYGPSVVFGGEGTGKKGDQGEKRRIIYLRNESTGGITAPITIDLEKLDNEKPYDLQICFPGADGHMQDGVKYYDGEITVVFTARDDTSGVDTFSWSYVSTGAPGTAGVPGSVDVPDGAVKTVGGEIPAVRDKTDPTRYTASLTLPERDAEQLRGYLEVSARDRAGNVSDLLREGDVFVVDTIPPVRSVSYGLRDEGGTCQTVGTKHYFSGPVDFVFHVTEANFLAEDVHITVSKDGAEAREQSVLWNPTDAAGEYEAVLTLADDGDYVVGMTYTDRSGHEMQPYTSETIVVDTTAPVISFAYADYSAARPQTATITVTEHNFRQSDLSVSTQARDITGLDVPVEDLEKYLQSCQWEHEGDVHRARISEQFADAIYVLTCNYRDLALNPAAEVRTAPFVVDHTPPKTDKMSISYSLSIKDTVLAAITLGFYNPAVTVTFTAYDETAGVDYFTWNYKRQEGASAQNVEQYADTRTAAAGDPVDRAKFTASVTLPGEQAQQLRGRIAFTATDRYGNVSEKLTDNGHVLVVDTVAPVIAVSCSAPDDASGGRLYYNRAMTATFTITEANFFPEDVIVMLVRDNGDPVQVMPVWKDISADVHVGTCMIEAPEDHTGDGDYVFTVRYTDRSDNAMEVCTSRTIVIDTMPPERSVAYGLREEGGTSQTVGTKHYFSGPVRFAFTVTERNFFAEDVHVTVSRDGAEAREQSVTWMPTDGADEYTAGIVLEEDGDYVVGMTYTDRTGHEMRTYVSETVVVDATVPVIAVDYEDYSGERPQTATVTVTEHNFRQSDISVTTEAKTITGLDVRASDLQNYLQNCQWEHEGDVHRARLSEQFADAIYVLTCNYCDLALNPAPEVTTEPFVVDHTPPSRDRMSVRYSTSVTDTVLAAITLGFYNPAVTVTFTAYDETAGVDYFTWNYMRQEGVSAENVERYEDTRTAAAQDAMDKAKFTASVTLPGEQARQLRGMIAFTATDRYGNESVKLTDSGHVLVVDTIAPAITAAYSEPDDTSGGKLYYNKALTATFTVTEANFFQEDVVVTLAKDGEAPVRVLPVWRDLSADVHVGTCVIEAPQDHGNDGDYVFTVSYTDRSDNTMEVYTSGVLVIDTVLPDQTVSFGLQDEGGTSQKVGTKHYFSGPVDFVFRITEKNFFPEDVRITVSKDGEETREQAVEWKSAGAVGEYTAGLTLTEDGDYIVGMTYADRTGHEMPSYISETVVVDATAPVIEFAYDDFRAENPQTATVTVTEHNFRQSDITVLTEARTITDQGVPVEDLENYLQSCEWEHEGDVHRAQVSEQFADAIYVLTCNYDDLALTAAEEVVTEPFVVDHTPPAADRMSVSYSTSVMDTVLGAITLGFYNPQVTVTFTAYDETAGVDYFTWSYTRQEGASPENVERYGDTRVDAVQDALDKAKFTASVTLPGEQARQLRGSMAFTATDRYGNESEKCTDSGHVLVVDTVSPVITAEYTTPDQTFGGKLYYNKALTATFTVTESNFFSEDVMVMLTKDDEEAVRVMPVWTDVSEDVHVGTYVIDAADSHANDGDYVFTVSYTDRSGNVMGAYRSDVFVIDTILPVIEVEYSDQNPVNTLADSQGITRKYFPAELSATLTITEHNFNAEEIEYIINATDVAGNELNAGALYRTSGWTSDGDRNTATIVFPGDANYSFDIAYTDLALHEMPDYPTDYFTVDTSMPENPEVSYSAGVLDTILDNISFGFYNAQMTVHVTAVDRISGVHDFSYSYLKTEGVSSVNAELIQQPIEEAQISFSEGGAMATASFQISQAALAAGNQFNGTVEVSATDRAGNQTGFQRDEKRIVVDNIAPTAVVEYNAPVQEIDNIAYYDGDIDATITVNEANFYPEDVTVSVTRDGTPYAVTPVWNDNNTDVHTGTFTLTGDGDYFVEITGSDKSGNVMQQYMSEQMTIDTQIEEAVITVNGVEADGKAFKEEVVLAVSFEDTNFEDYEILLTRTNFGNKNMDVTHAFIGEQVTTNAFGGSGSFDTFSSTPENDGIYTVTVTLSDRAGHTVEKTATFTVNRYGSVYDYSDYLVGLIGDGGAYVQRVEEDLLITEYNADRLVSQSLDIEISRDGRPLEDCDYRVTPEINDVAVTGNKGWYQYQYTIAKENFSQDGVYKISVSSRDQTGNTPENTNYADKAILFRVDSTAPEINSITGLENAIVNATSLEIKYSVYDTMGLASVAVYVDGKEKEDITDFTGDEQNYSGSLMLAENPQAQKVRLVVRDLAGNMTDTDAMDFISAFAFSHSVTISTNVIVRWYADKVLFWGSIGGTAAVAGTGTGGAVAFGRRRRRSSRA